MAVSTEHLLEAAAGTLARQPDATLQQIADAAGVSRTTLFYRFATRENLLQALAADTLDRIRIALTDVVWDVQDLDGTTREVSGRLMPLAERMQVTLRGGGRDTDPEQWRAALAPLIRFIIDGQRAGRLRSDLDPTWLAWAFGYLMFAGWDAHSAGSLTADAAALLIAQTWLGGARN